MVHRHFRGQYLAAVIAVFVVLLTSILPAPKASAAAPCSWTDKTTVTCSGEAFTNPTTNGNQMTLFGTSATSGNGGNCQADSIVISPYQTATSGQLTTWKIAVNGKFGNSCTAATTKAALAKDYTTATTACPGTDQIGVDCASIPLGCPGSTQQGPVSTQATLNCPYAPSANSSWNCTAKTCTFKNPAVTVKTGQTYAEATCPAGATADAATGSCTCSDGNAPQNNACPAQDAQNCGGQGFDWAVCPADSLFQFISSGLLDMISSLMNINIGAGGIFGGGANGNAYYRAWDTFRILGTSLIVIAGLIMVASQAFGLEIMDAYTIRKVLPRLLIAVVAMSLSWPLLSFTIGFFNTLGADIRNLMYAPFSTLPNHAQLTDGIISYTLITVLIAGVLTKFGGVLFPILGIGALDLLVAVIVLIVRQLIVTILVVTAPLAIAAYVLPNTKKGWDLWKDNFLGVMIMYVLVEVFIASGEIFSAVGKSGGAAQQIIGIIAFYVPFFLIPMAFRMATGLISTISGAVHNGRQGLRGRLRGAAGNIAKRQGARIKDHHAYNGDGKFVSRMNTFLGRAANANKAFEGGVGWNPRGWARNMGNNMTGFESRHSLGAAREKMEKDEAFKMFSGNEDYGNAYFDAHGDFGKMRQILQASVNRDGHRNYSDASIDQAITQMKTSQRTGSREVFEQALALSLPATGTAFATKFDEDGNVVSGGAGEMVRRINQVWGNDRLGATSALVTARGLAAQARRFDLAGGGTADQIGSLEANWEYMQNPGKTVTFKDEAGNDITMAADEKGISEKTLRESLKGQGGSYIAGTKTKGVDAFAQIMGKDIKAQVNRDQANKDTFNETVRQFANLGGRYDSMAGAPPDAVDKLEKVMNEKVVVDLNFAAQINNAAGLRDPKTGSIIPVIGPGEYTNRQILESMREVPGFLDRRRELGSRGAQAAAMLNAQQVAMGTPQPGPVAPPGGLGPLPGPMG
jgi:hypothetical protein